MQIPNAPKKRLTLFLSFLALSVSASVKAASRTLMKMSPAVQGYQTLAGLLYFVHISKIDKMR